MHGLDEDAFDGTFEGYVRDMHPDDRPRVLAAIMGAAEAGSDLDIEYRIVLPDGSMRWVAGRGTAFRDESGAVARMAGTCQDITDRVRANEDKEVLFSFAAHELRSPLTSVLGFARILERLIRANPEQYDEVFTEAVQTISTESSRMKEIIELFLDLARAESGQLQLETNEVDVVELLKREIEMSVAKSPSARIDAHLPDCPLPIVSDARRLEQVISNLLDNAIKYGGNPPHVVVTCSLHAGHVVISFKDDGAGIAEGDRPYLFDRFYRGQTASDARAIGTGIGLYLSKQFVTQLGGRLELTSAPGEPTEFCVTLPA